MTEVFTDNFAQRTLFVEVDPYVVSDTAEVTQYLSTEDFITGGSDSPANQLYIGCIMESPVFKREMFDGSKIGVPVFPDRGNLTIINVLDPDTGTAEFDDWLDSSQYNWQGRAIRMYVKLKDETYNERVQILDGIIDRISYNENTITFFIRNKQYLLDKLMQPAKVLGNLMYYSEDFDNADWTKTRMTVSANDTTAPNGTTTADKIINTTDTGTHLILNDGTITAQESNVFSVYVKPSPDRYHIRLQYGDAGGTNDVKVDINIVEETVGTISETGTVHDTIAGVERITKDWYRVWLSCRLDSTTTTGRGRLFLLKNDGTLSYTGTTSEFIHVWGAMFNRGTVAGVYIPTYSTLTDVPDNAYGKPAQISFGECFNVEAVLISASKLIYMLNDPTMALQAISAGRDKGSGFTAGSSKTTYKALHEDSVSNDYNYSASYGLVRLAAAPDGKVTFDITGHDLTRKIVRNLLDVDVARNTYADDQSGAGWWDVFTHYTVTAGITAPDGSKTAANFVYNGSGNGLMRTGEGLGDAAVEGETLYVSAYIRLNSIAQSTSNDEFLTIDYGDGAGTPINQSDVRVGEWVRIKKEVTAGAGNHFDFLVTNDSNTTAMDFDLWGVQMERVGFTPFEGFNHPSKNMLTYSEDMDGADWSVSGVGTTSEDGTLAPNKTSPAQKLTDNDSDNIEARWTQAKTSNSDVEDDQFYTSSIFIKKGDEDVIEFGSNIYGATAVSGAARFTFSTKTFSNLGGAVVDTGYEELDDGWFRLWSVFQNNDSGNSNFVFYIYPSLPSAGSLGYSYLWGAKLEKGGAPTAYVPDSATYSANNYEQMPAEIAKFISQGLADIPPVNNNKIAQTNSKLGFKVQFHTGMKEVNMMDAMGLVMNSIHGFSGFDRAADAALQTGVLDIPPATDADLEFEQSDLHDNSLKVRKYGQVAWKVIVRWKPNFSPQSSDEMATGLSAADKKLYADEYREVFVADENIKVQYSEAIELVWDTLLSDEEDAYTLAQYLMDYYGAERLYAEFRCGLEPLQYDINNTVEITHPRFGLSNGKKFSIINMNEQPMNGITDIKGIG